MTKKNQSSQRKRARHDQNDEFDNAYIIEDLIVEILLRVPALSVISFKRVCKNWYTLISNPDFLRKHSSLHSEKHTDLLVHGFTYQACPVYQHFEFVFLPQDKLQPPLLKMVHPLALFPESHKQGYLDHSCNGLLLLFFTDVDNWCVANRTYYVFNLMTNQYFKLPSTYSNFFPEIREEEYEATSYIVFDPSVSLSYKVIRWLEQENVDPANIHCQLYSSETGSWRLLSTSYWAFQSRPTLLNGVLYWSYWSTTSDVLHCFDVAKESFSFLPLPPKPIGYFSRQCLYFGECDGGLRLIEKYLYLDSHECIGRDPLTLPCSFDIMEMHPEQQQRPDDCCPWIVKYHVNIEMVFNRPVLREHPCEVEVIHCYRMNNKGRGEEEEEVLLLNINQTSMVSYNLTSNTFGKELTIPKSWSQPDFMSWSNGLNMISGASTLSLLPCVQFHNQIFYVFRLLLV